MLEQSVDGEHDLWKNTSKSITIMRKEQGESMLPEAFLERMQSMLQEEYEEFLQSFEKEKYQALRLNALKIGAGGKKATETPEGFAHLTKVPWAENGYYYQAQDQPGKHPYHEAGVYYIQEPSAMAPVELLHVMPGDRVLDLCAAPGGKSTQIAAKLLGDGFLVCNEIHPARARILSENVERMGIGNACVTNETPAHLAEVFPEYFDKILVDAPCSGEGMFRKNEAACEEWSPENVQLCAERQDEILDCAAKMLLPGGRLVYSTCTFAPAENEGSISRFLERHPEFRILPIDKDAMGITGGDGVPEWARRDEMSAEQTAEQSAERLSRITETLRLWPHKIKGEGHYAAVLQKSGSVPEGYRARAMSGVMKSVPEKELTAFSDFCTDALLFSTGKNALKADVKKTGSMAGAIASACGISNEVQYLKFGDNLYLVGADMPALQGLKVLRPGLHLGELKKNRFEPAHALALALRPDNASHVWQLSGGGNEAKAYLNGQTFAAEGEKGWYLICVDGFGLGWGKLAGGIMKNHYPKGLRR